MSVVSLRVFLFSMLPLIVAAAHAALDKSARSRERRLEIFPKPALLICSPAAIRRAERSREANGPPQSVR
jgi:hypothetical protein